MKRLYIVDLPYILISFLSINKNRWFLLAYGIQSELVILVDRALGPGPKLCCQSHFPLLCHFPKIPIAFVLTVPSSWITFFLLFRQLKLSFRTLFRNHLLFFFFSVWNMAFDFILDNVRVVLQQSCGSTLKLPKYYQGAWCSSPAVP